MINVLSISFSQSQITLAVIPVINNFLAFFWVPSLSIISPSGTLSPSSALALSIGRVALYVVRHPHRSFFPLPRLSFAPLSPQPWLWKSRSPRKRVSMGPAVSKHVLILKVPPEDFSSIGRGGAHAIGVTRSFDKVKFETGVEKKKNLKTLL